MCALGSLSIIGGFQDLIICVKMAWSEHLVGSDCGDKYAVEISYIFLFVFFQRRLKNLTLSKLGGGGGEQSHSVNRFILFEMTCIHAVGEELLLCLTDMLQ